MQPDRTVGNSCEDFALSLQVNCKGLTHTTTKDGNRGTWESTGIKFHVDSSDKSDSAKPCTKQQQAIVDGCVSNCKNCKTKISAWKKAVVRCPIHYTRLLTPHEHARWPPHFH